jgi:two-component system, NarL family, nitrate/nitrite response regulator NarL
MESARPITVVLADDQRAYREGLVRAIEGHAQLELVAVARDGDEALQAVEAHAPDVALVDVRMSGMEGPAVCAELRRRRPDIGTRLILMSAQDGSALSEQAERSGADGFVSKERSRREICDALVEASDRFRRRAALASLESA